MSEFTDYFKLLQEVGKTLEKLEQIAQRKILAVKRDDMVDLDACMKEEQALSLALRGYDRRREAAIAKLGLQGVPLSGLVSHCPPELKAEAKAVVEKLRDQYTLYQSAASAARTTLEINLHEMEKLIAAQSGEDPAAGYQGKGPEPETPKPMKTDFRA